MYRSSNTLLQIIFVESCNCRQGRLALIKPSQQGAFTLLARWAKDASGLQPTLGCCEMETIKSIMVIYKKRLS